LISIDPSVLASRLQMAMQPDRIASLNMGRPREIQVESALVRTTEASTAAGKRAVYPYAHEDLDWWSGGLGRPLGSGRSART
jgi:hypothetical protein